MRERSGCSLHLLDSCIHRQLLSIDLADMVKLQGFHASGRSRHTVRRRAGGQWPPLEPGAGHPACPAVHTRPSRLGTQVFSSCQTSAESADLVIQAAGLRLPVAVVFDGHASSREDFVVVGPGGTREIHGLISTIVCGQELSPNLSWPALILAVQCLQFNGMDAWCLMGSGIPLPLKENRHARVLSNLTGRPYPQRSSAGEALDSGIPAFLDHLAALPKSKLCRQCIELRDARDRQVFQICSWVADNLLLCFPVQTKYAVSVCIL